MSAKPPPNRGRIQAQGPDTEESEAWPPPDAAPTKSQMLEKLELVRAKLSPQEQEDREECFDKARRFIERAPPTGYDAPCIKSWPNRKMRGGVRVDIEIQLGKACVEDPPEADEEDSASNSGD
jgi:hypothetical protein